MSRRLYQLHTSFMGRSPGFLAITIYTGADDVFPCVLTSPVAWYHVVERKVSALLAAVLAGVSIPIEYLVAGHLALAMGASYQLRQADNRGQLDGLSKRMDIAEAVFNHLRFALPDEDDGAAGAADG